ncbi:MAG: hypothetical protein JRN12_00220 [Nitrososphaerota archaeon]|nr:hypothetical protein [Nitrososphaerota archaeon]MDG6942555.1 hypothetical protein [Nitrososphaerota archaeon]MDG6950268.1 hypothetical protein [Nitrososphaerota archaeon]
MLAANLLRSEGEFTRIAGGKGIGAAGRTSLLERGRPEPPRRASLKVS